VLRLSEEAVEFAASGVEGTLFFFRAVVNKRAAVLMDHVAEKSVCNHFSKRRIVVEVADDLAAQQPEVVYMFTDSLRRKTG